MPVRFFVPVYFLTHVSKAGTVSLSAAIKDMVKHSGVTDCIKSIIQIVRMISVPTFVHRFILPLSVVHRYPCGCYDITLLQQDYNTVQDVCTYLRDSLRLSQSIVQDYLEVSRRSTSIACLELDKPDKLQNTNFRITSQHEVKAGPPLLDDQVISVRHWGLVESIRNIIQQVNSIPMTAAILHWLYLFQCDRN